jgi:hypothetical protein
LNIHQIVASQDGRRGISRVCSSACLNQTIAARRLDLIGGNEGANATADQVGQRV